MIWQRDPGDEDDAPLKRLEAELRSQLGSVEETMRQLILNRGWPLWLADYYGPLK